MGRRPPNRPSKIDRLPKDLRDLIEKLRKDGATIDEIMAHLGEFDVDVSRSSLGRHIIPIDDMIVDAKRAKFEAAEMAQALRDAGGVNLSALNRELLESEYFKFYKRLRELQIETTPGLLKELASGQNSLSRSRATEQEMQRKADKDAEERLKAKLDKAVSAGEIDPEAVARAKRILGFD